MYIYLCGCLTYLDQIGELDHSKQWRDKFKTWAKDNSIKVFDPMETYLIESNHELSMELIVNSLISS